MRGLSEKCTKYRQKKRWPPAAALASPARGEVPLADRGAFDGSVSVPADALGAGSCQTSAGRSPAPLRRGSPGTRGDQDQHPADAAGEHPARRAEAASRRRTPAGAGEHVPRARGFHRGSAPAFCSRRHFAVALSPVALCLPGALEPGPGGTFSSRSLPEPRHRSPTRTPLPHLLAHGGAGATEPFGHRSRHGGQARPGGAEVSTGGQKEGRKGISPTRVVPRLSQEKVSRALGGHQSGSSSSACF